jgi:hypothetical protein
MLRWKKWIVDTNISKKSTRASNEDDVCIDVFCGGAQQRLAADGAIACFSSSFFPSA